MRHFEDLQEVYSKPDSKVLHLDNTGISGHIEGCFVELSVIHCDLPV